MSLKPGSVSPVIPFVSHKPIKINFSRKDLFESYSMQGVWIWVPLLSGSCLLAWNQWRSRLLNQGLPSVICCAQTESNQFSCRNSIWNACINSNLCYNDMFCQSPGREFRNPYTTVYGCKHSPNGTEPTVFCRITWLRITIVFLRVVYEGIQVVYDRKRSQ